MNKTGPIVIIEDDMDDQVILKDVFHDINLKNGVIFFENGVLAYEYLVKSSEQPFLILSDINLPKLNGFELRDMVHNNERLRLKCIPYLFFTTASEQGLVIEAYSKSVQGFFVKPGNYAHLKKMMENIVEYWSECHSPNVIL